MRKKGRARERREEHEKERKRTRRKGETQEGKVKHKKSMRGGTGAKTNLPVKHILADRSGAALRWRIAPQIL